MKIKFDYKGQQWPDLEWTLQYFDNDEKDYTGTHFGNYKAAPKFIWKLWYLINSVPKTSQPRK